jgi:hypothetical protein
MTCREVEQALAMSNAKQTDILMQSVRGHIEDCESCRELVQAVELPFEDAQVSSGQIERLQAMIAGDLHPVRPLLPSWVFLLIFALIFVGLTYLGITYLGTPGWFVLMPVQKIAVLSTLAASASLLAFSLVRQMVPGEKPLLHTGLLPAGLFVLLCLVVASVFQIRTDPHFLRAGRACLQAGVPYAIPAGLLFWLILRRGAILSSRAVGAAAGMLAGLVSTTVLEVHCPNLNVWHILVWHVGIALSGLVAGLLIAVAGQVVRDRIS